MQFAYLGPLEVTGPEGPVPLGKPQQRAVLAMLLLEANRVVSIERIIDDLWDDAPPNHAAGAVQATISTLRRVLEPDRPARAAPTVLVSQNPGYMLRASPQQIDAARFEQLVDTARRSSEADPNAALSLFDEALQLWRGTPMADFVGQPWAVQAVTRYEALRAAAVEHRFDVLLAMGRHDDAIVDLEAAVTANPLRERLWGQLMVALYRGGRQGEALRAFQRARSFLADELGIDPSPALQDLEAQILAHSSALDRVRPLVADSWDAPASGARDASDDTARRRLVGRDLETQQLMAASIEARRGHGAVIAIGGDAGVGKSRLAEEAARRLSADGFTVAWGRSVEGGIAPALWPLIQVASTLGEAGNTLSDALTSEPALDAEGRAQMYRRAVAAIGHAAGARPLAIILEDIQWADPATHHVAQLLVSRVPEHPIVLIVTCRDQSLLSEDCSATLAAIARANVGRRMTLAALSPADVGELISQHLERLATRDEVDLLWRRSGGNAFYLTELIRLIPAGAANLDAVGRSIPPSVRDVVMQRVSATSDDTARLVTVAAVLGRSFDRRIAQQLAGLDDVAATDALDLATVTGLIEWDRGGTRHRFRHDLTREAINDHTTASRRVLIHADAVAALQSLYGDAVAHRNEIAAHAWAGRSSLDPSIVVELLVAAATASAAGYAAETADEQLQRALDVVAEGFEPARREQVGLEIATMRARIRSTFAGFADSTTSAAFADALARRARVASDDMSPQTLMELAGYVALSGRIAEARAMAEDLIEIGRLRADALAECAGHNQLGLFRWYAGDITGSAASVQRGIDIAATCAPEHLVQAFGFPVLGTWLSFLAMVLAVAGDDRAASVADASAVELARQPHTVGALWADVFSTWRAVIDEQPIDALSRAERCLRSAERIGLGIVVPMSELPLGWGAAHRGDKLDALETIRRGRRGFVTANSTALVLAGVALEADVLMALDRTDEALLLVETAIGQQRTTGEGLWLPEVHRLHGRLLADHDPGAARQAFETAIRIGTAQGAHRFADRAADDLAKVP